MLNFLFLKKYKKNFFELDKKKKQEKIVFLNPHSYTFLFSDLNYFNAIDKCTSIFIDGIGLYYLLKIKYFIKNKKFNYHKITGYDYFNYVIQNNYEKNILLIGATSEKLRIIKKSILIDNPSLKVYTHDAPFVEKEFSKSDLDLIFKNVDKNIVYDYCFVSTGAPKQEKLVNLIDTHLMKTNKFYIRNISSIGAVFDYYSSENSQNFLFFFKNLNLEWLYRILVTPKIISRTIFSFPKYIYHVLFSKTPNYFKVIIKKNPEKILYDKDNFILSAFNLASYSFMFSNNITVNKNFIFWNDGVFSKLFLNLLKVPGRKLINNLKISNDIKNIHVIGDLHKKCHEYLVKKFNKNIIHSQLPYGTVEKIVRKLPSTKKKELILITLPTPKQEIIANEIIKKNKFAKIICIGGGLNLAAKVEKPCPKLFENLYLESLWRLRYETIRRTLRLLNSFILLIFSFLSNFQKRITFDVK